MPRRQQRGAVSRREAVPDEAQTRGVSPALAAAADATVLGFSGKSSWESVLRMFVIKEKTRFFFSLLCVCVCV